MFLEEFHAQQFRNLSDFKLKLSQDLNVISGDNAAGKSSLLEAIGYLVSGRSFRTSKQNLLIAHDQQIFNLYGRFSNSTKIGVSYNILTKLKKIRLDGQAAESLSMVASLYPVQVLSPESYHLIDSGPLERRKYLDWLLFHVEHSYQKDWVHFQRVLKQRNALLRLARNSSQLLELKAWSDQYCESALKIDRFRQEAAQWLLPEVKKVLASIEFEYVDDLNISYYSGYTGCLSDKLEESLEKDLANGTTQYGPHKADLRIKINGHLAKDLLSRGQKKLLVNSLYLSQTQLLKEKTEKDSLFIVDDFSSELDEGNQKVLVEALRKQKNVQIILSCLQAGMLKSLIKGYNNVKMFHVEHGEINEV